MNVFTDFEARVRSAVASVNASAELSEAELARVTVEPPRDPSHGDLATNAAMVLAKPLGRKPRELAEDIAAALPDLVQFQRRLRLRGETLQPTAGAVASSLVRAD